MPESTSNHPPPLLYALVFFGGFANLAAEIIGPRMFASLFGTTTVVWAIMISVTLVGLSVGYALGGRIHHENIIRWMPRLLVANAMWLLLVSWIVWELPASIAASGTDLDSSAIILTAMIAFFPPSVMFGMLSPMTITLLAHHQPPTAHSRITGNIYAVSTVGSVAGALSAAFYLIPWIGLSTSMRLFAAGLLLFALILWHGNRRWWIAAAFLLCAFVPQPDWVWSSPDDVELLAQREGLYQTIRVYGDETHIWIHLGPSFHSRMNRATREPDFSYVVTMLGIIELLFPDLTGRQVLIIGGAGHGLSHAMENRGATVTEVEIDPVVVELSDRYFGEIQGEVVLQDGRVYMEQAEENVFDLVIVDVFDGAANVPPQFATLEFFEAVERTLKPDGVLTFNFIGTPEGQRSRSFRALTTTMQNALDHAGANDVTGTSSQNILLAASNRPLDDANLLSVPTDGHLLTDDHNPIEIFTAEARDFIYFRRQAESLR